MFAAQNWTNNHHELSNSRCVTKKFAARKSRYETVKTLIELGADMNHQNGKGAAGMAEAGDNTRTAGPNRTGRLNPPSEAHRPSLIEMMHGSAYPSSTWKSAPHRRLHRYDHTDSTKLIQTVLN